MARVLAAGLALLLTTALLAPSRAGLAIPYENTERVPGGDAVSVAIALSQRLFDDGAASGAVLARKDLFPDALGASALAAHVDGPVLYTSSDRLDPVTRGELGRVLDTGRDVYLMGGTVALSQGVENELQGLGYRTRRLGGETRVETAALAAREVGAGPGRTAIVARAFDSPGHPPNTQGWVDSVSCGGFAAAEVTPILLTDHNRDPERIPSATRSTLQRLGIEHVFVCGGPMAVPEAHAEDIRALGIAVERFEGETRIGTAVDVARRLWDVPEPDGRSFLLVNGWGTNFAFGIAAAQLSAREQAPILLVDADEPSSCAAGTISSPTLCYLATHDEPIARLIVVGSEGLVSDAVFEAAARAGGLVEVTDPPTVPEGATATDVPEDDGTQLEAAWLASTHPQGVEVLYDVYYRPSEEPGELTRANGFLAPGSPTTDTRLVIGGLTRDQPYDVAVAARDRFGHQSALSDPVTATPIHEPPAAPNAAPNVQNVAEGLRLSWVPAPEAHAIGYAVERLDAAIVGGCTENPVTSREYQLIGQVSGRSSTTFTDADVEAGQSYCYRYRVVDVLGAVGDPSPDAGPIARDGDGGGVALAWRSG